MALPVILTPGELPEGISCFSTEQQRYNTYISHTTATLEADTALVIKSTSQPTVDQQGAIWVKLNGDGSLNGVFTFFSGAWVRPHPIPASSDYRALWVGTLGDLALFEGGDAGAISTMTGAFWVQDTDFTDKIPIGAGTVAAVSTNDTHLDISVQTQDVRGVYIIKRSARNFYVA